MPRPCRASIFAMVGSKLTINAQPPESVRVRLRLRWLGSRPGRVPVNTPERFNPESVPPPDSTLPLDAAARVVDQGPSGRCRPSPGSAPSQGPPAGADGPSAAPEGSGQLPGRISEGSRQLLARIRPPSPPGALVPRPAPRHRGDRRPRRTALPPLGAPRTHLESSSNRPRRFRPASPKDPATVPTGRARPSPSSAPSRGSPAWPDAGADGTSAARRPSNPPRIVPEPSPKVPASFPTGRARPSQGSAPSPGSPTWSDGASPP